MHAEPLGLPLAEALENKVISPNMDLPQLVEKFAEFGWSEKEVGNIWAFGPDATNNNILVNATTSVQYVNELKDYIVSSFQMAYDVTTMADAIHRGAGQIIHTSLRCMYASELSAQPRLVEPCYLADITCPEQSLGGVQSALSRRRGTIIEEKTTISGFFNFKAYLPVKESFGFSLFLSDATRGLASIQLSFDHWESIDSDPLDLSSSSGEIVRSIRIYKRLKGGIPTAAEYQDKL
ncbi:hypothetical protein DFA_05015 [Cavenderia fasciculata]|uniref:Elongation factor EFG domain-containing protein n=1 Tax=Cavenderia fasciculata TaxID=261658 RepID=F4PMZ2_CACFS|nr:uncharacterized protein DFA_05015 [Cavenderia fasciculata]EGG22885.1 hypothetical protein DFA_05015 [Cavenderia fasciculata]|eukprot:XP_004360736.1 hypothetical protein DFA_05015 [Cavenderia fasciculata]